MASTKAGSSSRALSLALERDESRWKPCCKRSSSRDESRDRSPRGALVIIAAKLPDGRPTGGYRELPSGKQSSQVVKNPVGVEKLASKTRFPSGEFLPIRVFFW